MSSSLLLLILCYAVLGFLLIGLCLFTRWPMILKAAGIVVVTGFAYLSYDALLGMLGYPAQARLPERFVFHGGLAIAPDKNKQDKGVIYLWVSEINADGPSKLPRAYAVPFDKEFNTQMNEAIRRSREGLVQLGQTTESLTREGSSAVSRVLATNLPQRIRFKDMPDPALPEK